jgi:hypothetical protein
MPGHARAWSSRRWRRVTVVAATAAIVAGSLTQGVPAAAVPPEPRNLAAGLDYTWSQEPDPTYPDEGRELTDGRYGELDIADPAWVGHRVGKTREVVFDLGTPKSISRIQAHFLQDWPTSSVLVPLTVSFAVSHDRRSWATLGHRSTQLLWGSGPPRDETYVWDGERDGLPRGNPNATMAYARYVKVSFAVHTWAWHLLDEVEIHGVDGKLPQAKTPKPDRPGYLTPGPRTAGIEDLVLLYNGHYDHGKGDWTASRIVPYLSYVDTHGKPMETLFDGVLYLGLRAPNGRNFALGEATIDDWRWYLTKTFARHGDLAQLDEATRRVAQSLDKPSLRTKVVLMIPNPGEVLTDFGDVDGDGVPESVSDADVGPERALANREKIVRWWVDEVLQSWAEARYSHLELVGLYWLEEQISVIPAGPDLLRRVSDIVHRKNLTLFWIPHFLAYKSHMASEVGIDAAAFQPNYFFETMSAERLEDAAAIAQQYGMGVEVEFDERMLTDDVFRERFVECLDAGAVHGFMTDAFLAYYQGNDTVYQAAVSEDPRQRQLYEWLHEFVRGTYQPRR